MSLAFTTATKRRTPLTFTLDEVEYTFTPPKTGGVIIAFLSGEGADATQALFDWLGEGLGEKQNEAIINRLKDTKDDFDTSDLVNIAQGLLAQVSGRPTRPSGGSSRKRR